MCMAYERKCECGARSVSFHFRDNILSEKVIESLVCPSCRGTRPVDPSCMVVDNGWLLGIDMDMVRFLARGRLPEPLTPDAVFDEGYCTWNGMYPGDHIDSVREREQIAVLAKTDPKEYLQKMRSWAGERTERLCYEGWRKAKNAA